MNTEVGISIAKNSNNNKIKYSNFDLEKFRKVELKFYLNKERNNGKDETIQNSNNQ